jgi:hypothetical protein
MSAQGAAPRGGTRGARLIDKGPGDIAAEAFATQAMIRVRAGLKRLIVMAGICGALPIPLATWLIARLGLCHD